MLKVSSMILIFSRKNYPTNFKRKNCTLRCQTKIVYGGLKKLNAEVRLGPLQYIHSMGIWKGRE